jgi:very-short-patch-repair endonuclease
VGVCGVIRLDELGDPAVARIAGSQYGAIDVEQLAAAGLRRDAIDYRVSRGRLHRQHRGVYLLGHSVSAPLAREAAALLACRPDSLLSHRTAAALWGLLPPDDEAPVDVTVIGRDLAGRRGIRVHRARLDPGDIRRRHRLPVTSPARTLLDVAGSSPSRRSFERAFDEARVGRLVTDQELNAQAHAGGHRGAPVIRALLRRESGPAFTRSEAEERLLALIRAARLPAPRVNARVGRHEVDLLWEEQRLVVEIDGYAFHSSRAAFERDRLRDAELQALGFRVMRVTWRQIAEEPHALLARIAQALVA